MRIAFELAGSAALAVFGLVVVVLFGLIGRQYGGPCTTDACTNPGADKFLFVGAILVVLGVLAFALAIRSGLRARHRPK